jgi:O-antigen/teichoic acid export membrane protein
VSGAVSGLETGTIFPKTGILESRTMASGTAVSPVKTSAPTVAAPLRVAFSWVLAGNVIYYGCQWAMLSVLAKLGSAAVVGQFALGLAVAAPVFMFTNLQLRGVEATDSRSEFAFADYFTLRCLATCLGFAVIVGIVFFSRYDHHTAVIVLLVAGAKVVEALSDVVLGLMQKNERLDQLAGSLIFKGVASIIVFTAVFWRTRSLVAAVAAMGLTWLVVFLSYDFRIARRTIGPDQHLFRINEQSLHKLVLLSLPLGVVMSLMSLNTNIPRYLVEHYLGHGQLGIFASLAYVATASSLVINALGQSAAARLSRMFAAQQFDGFAKLIKKFILLGALIGVAGVPAALLFGRMVLTFLYRSEYADSFNVFITIIATTSLFAMAAFLGYGLTAARCFKRQMIGVGAATLATLSLAPILVPRFGLMGAAFTLLAGAFVQLIGFALLLASRLHIARQTFTNLQDEVPA